MLTTAMVTTAIVPTKEEIIKKLKEFVKKKYNGNPKKAFDAYARLEIPRDLMDKKAINKFLKDAGIGWITRKVAVPKIVEEFDKNGDGKLSWDEISPALKENN